MEKKKTTTRDMTQGNIVKQVLLFALPLMLGNVFQMLYNTVDSVVVGQFVSTQALAAVGSTTMIVNMLVFFFNGFSIGASVVIGIHFGAKNMEKLHKAVETTIAATFVMCVAFTVIGYVGVVPMLRLMSTPEDVFPEATEYLHIYFAGFSGLLIYNMGSAVLRSVGDTTRPLYFLVLTSVLNIILDLVFVLVFHMGIAGVAYATILSQFISAGLILWLLTASKDIYRLTWNDLAIDGAIMKHIFSVGLPAGIQSVITAFSNVFVQSYINVFGSDVMAGWSACMKIDQFMMLPMQSVALAATTFVGQNHGARREDRVKKGTRTALGLSMVISIAVMIPILSFAPVMVKLFNSYSEVVRYGSLFLRLLSPFYVLCCVNQILASTLRGLGDSKAPMIIMLGSFVVFRQIYLMIVSHLTSSVIPVAMGYPMGWLVCSLCIAIYYRKKIGRLMNT
mgnify:CR=1 FL=1